MAKKNININIKELKAKNLAILIKLNQNFNKLIDDMLKSEIDLDSSVKLAQNYCKTITEISKLIDLMNIAIDDEKGAKDINEIIRSDPQAFELAAQIMNRLYELENNIENKTKLVI
ncbi:MAG: hypothetical protein KGZ71_01580 [Desulfobulbaceae bacterium]|nr:hypothetical protein [Desulfobulbaceae bacterium]